MVKAVVMDDKVTPEEIAMLEKWRKNHLCVYILIISRDLKGDFENAHETAFLKHSVTPTFC